MTDLMQSTLPTQLQPVVLLVSVAADGAAARERWSSVATTDGEALLPVAAADANVLPQPDAVHAMIPASAVAQVDELAQQLASLLRQVLPPLPGETVSSEYVSCLTAACGGLSAGTVGYRRTTNFADVILLFPRVSLDLQTGRPALTGLRTEPMAAPHVAPVAPHPTGMIPLVRSRPGLAADDDGDGGSSAAGVVYPALTVAQTLAWALPPPWSAATAAGLSMIQMFLGGSGDSIATAVQSLEEFEADQQVKQYSTIIDNAATQLNTMVGTMQLMKQDSTVAEDVGWVQQTLQPWLQQFAGPSSQLSNAIAQLEANYITRGGVLDVTMLGVSLYLLADKLKVQADALVASNDYANNDLVNFDKDTGNWLGNYTTWVLDTLGLSTGDPHDGYVPVTGWAATMAGHVTDLVTARLAKVSEPYRYNNAQPEFNPASGGTCYIADWGWTFKDSGAGDSDMTHWVGDTYTSGKGCCSNGKDTQHEDVVVAARAAYVSDLTGQLQTQYANQNATIKQWIAAIDDWNEHLPPRSQPSAPTVAAATSGTPIPSGGWTAGASVQYALTFVNEQGPGLRGPWSAPVDVGSYVGATLTDLSQDPLKMATSMWLARQITTDTTAPVARTVGVIAPDGDGNFPASYTDVKP